jgi:hypothetical protein
MSQYRLLVTGVLLVFLWACSPPPVTAQSTYISGNRTLVGSLNGCGAAGGPNAYTCTLDPPMTILPTGACFGFIATTGNTGASTLAVNGQTPIAIMKRVSGVQTVLASGDIGNGQFVTVCYDGTVFQVQSLGGGGSSSGVRSVAIPAGSMDVLGGCITNDSAALVTNGPRLPTITCADDDAASLEFAWPSPDGWNAGTITIALHAFSIGNNTTEVLEMDFAGQCVSSGDTPTAHATTGEQAATITWGNTANREQYATTAAITIQGTCAAGDRVYMRGQIDATATTVTPMTDIKILGVKIEYNRTGDD